jgi:four helix bundle protein
MAVLQDLIVWQLADELRNEVIRLTDVASARVNFRFRDQVRSAASSVPTNIAEGYGRHRHTEFARFLEFASGSLRETEDWLRDGARRGIWTETDIAPARRLCKRLTPALGNLRRYLRATETPK